MAIWTHKTIGAYGALSKYWPGNMLSMIIQSGAQHAELLPGVLTGLVFLIAAYGGVIHLNVWTITRLTFYEAHKL